MKRLVVNLATKDDITNDGQCIELPNGWYATVSTPYDEDYGPPWEEHDGHGEVSKWTTRDKRPGERVLVADGKMRRYYDFAGAVETARKDGWDAPPYGTGTRGETAARAAEADYEYLQQWCNDGWCWIGVIVTLFDAEGEEVESDSIWGVESLGEYWRELAAEMMNGLASGRCTPNAVEERAS